MLGLSKASLAIAMVFVGCCSNVVFLEMVVKTDPGAGNLVTFLQFLFIALVGFISISKFGTAPRHIPIKEYIILVGFFFTSSVTNNYAFDFNISMPLHMIFRAGSLMANMVMGVWILRKSYPPLKYLAVFMISAGIIICTVQSSQEVTSRATLEDPELEAEQQLTDWLYWCVGIAILTFALFVSARMGIYQESLYSTYGKRPWEALFYTHLIPLPFWLPTAGNLVQHMQFALASTPVNILGLMVPQQVVNLVLYVVTQGVCISSVYVLTTECSSLTVTLTVTLRKFVSLIFSIIYFKNPFTAGHWIGTILVFLGTMIFTELLQKAVHAVLSPTTAKRKLQEKKKD